MIEKTIENFKTDGELLADDCKVEIHDKNLLKAIDKNGFWYVKFLSHKKEYEFLEMKIESDSLLKRAKALCQFFEENIADFKEHCKKEGVRSGDKATGVTKIDLKKKFTKVNLDRDEEGNVIYPIVIAPTLQILNLGVVEWERPGYHSEKNIFPIGFKSLRKGTSMTVLGKTEEYICEIQDGGTKPLFKVTASSEPNKPFISNSSSGVWIDICKRINDLMGGQRKNVTVSGPERYGLTEAGVN
jgi:hypothetical protein